MWRRCYYDLDGALINERRLNKSKGGGRRGISRLKTVWIRKLGLPELFKKVYPNATAAAGKKAAPLFLGHYYEAGETMQSCQRQMKGGGELAGERKRQIVENNGAAEEDCAIELLLRGHWDCSRNFVVFVFAALQAQTRPNTIAF